MNKTTTYDPMLEAPADAQEKIRAIFAAMDRIDERIAKDQEEIARLTVQLDRNLADIKARLTKMGSK